MWLDGTGLGGTIRRGGDVPFISLFMIIPVSGTMSWEPKRRFTVVVSVMAIPEASTVTI